MVFIMGILGMARRINANAKLHVAPTVPSTQSVKGSECVCVCGGGELAKPGKWRAIPDLISGQ